MCRHWFRAIQPIGEVDGSFRAIVETSVHKSYLQKQCAEYFNDALQQETGRLVPILFVDSDTEPAQTTNGTANGHALSAICDDVVINPDYTFENFIEGPNNRLGAAAAKAVADGPGTAYNPLFVHGGVGLGKTHLLQAICQHVLDRQANASMLYVSCERFMSLFIDSVQRGECGAFRDRFRHLDVLVIDDIHFLAKGDRSQEEFFHTFNTLYQARKQIILSSDAKPDEIPALEERLVSRFNWGLVVEITAPSFETRLAIVRQKARVRELHLPDDVVDYIARKIDRNIRELEGAITRVQGQAMLTEGCIDMDTARAALGDNATEPRRRALSIQAIADAVVDHYDIRLTDLQSKRRQRSVTLPRQMCMYLARKHTSHSLAEIGGFFGGRDHTTVMHAVQAIESRQHELEHIRDDLRLLETKLQPFN